MDGVLSVFNEQACIEKPFNRIGSHYFRTCKPDFNAISLFKIINFASNTQTHVLTRIYLEIDDIDIRSSLTDEIIEDKHLWLKRYLPPDTDYIALRQTPDKSFVIRKIPVEDRESHILIDDDPAVLQNWKEYGGSAIQWLQPTRKIAQWEQGMTITPSSSIAEICATVLPYLRLKLN